MEIKTKQIKAVTEMMYPSTDWKFLIYDTIGKDILSPLLSLKELRNLGVTLHLEISSDRDPVPDVAAVYFVIPTEENIQRICKDLSDHCYESYYLNFISHISREVLETIANSALLSDTAINVKRVYDQYLNYISLEEDFFILKEYENSNITYSAINRSDVSYTEINIVIDSIVDSLFCFCVTMNVIPIIRCAKGGSSEYVADKLTEKIRNTLRDSKSTLFINDSKKPPLRPLLVLVDRNVDMSTPLHHTWTYQAMIHDLLDMKLNQVKLEEKDVKTNKTKTHFFDLNSKDDFWKEQKGSPFPQVADAVQRKLDEYKKTEDEVKRLQTTMGLDGNTDEIHLTESTAKLTTAVSSLPELLANKRIIGMHTTIATAVLDEIKSRKLDNFFEIEEKIMNRSLIDKATLDEMILEHVHGNPHDIYRLFLICYLCDNPKLSEEEVERYISVIEGLGCSRSAFNYIRNWKTFSTMHVESLQSSLQSHGRVPNTITMFSKLMSQGSQFVMEGVKNLVLREHLLPVTKIVDGLIDCTSKNTQESVEYAYLDPKYAKDQAAQRKRIFKEAIVFVVGGGTYVEYQNLVDYSKKKSVKIVYGATDLLNAERFIEQLEK